MWRVVGESVTGRSVRNASVVVMVVGTIAWNIREAFGSVTRSTDSYP